MVDFEFVMLAPRPRFVGLVSLDIDSHASRTFLVDRNTLQTIFVTLDSGQVYRVVPFAYVETPNLLAIMLDDNGQYNAVCNDVIRAELVDANTLAV